MSNTQTHEKKKGRWGHLAKFAAIHLGILLLLETDIAVMSASVLESGGGVFLKPMATATAESPATQSVLKAADTLHAAADQGLNAVITSQLITSILFVTLGFFLHVLWVSHKNNGERPVRVVEKKREKKTPQWYWIEMKI